MPSPSVVEPRTSAKRIATSTSAPPGARLSQQRVQRFGFLGEGRKPAMRNIRPPMPPNGLLQTLHRGFDGTARNMRREIASGRCPSVSSFSQPGSAMTRPYMSRSGPMRRLLTIPISHFCEKARWALDRAGLDYREERHAQGIHQVMAKRAGGGKTVPVLVADERIFPESEDVLRYADRHLPPKRRLFPEDGEDVVAVSRWLDDG